MGDSAVTAHVMKIVQSYLEDCKLDITQKTLEKEIQKKLPQVFTLLAQEERPRKLYLQELIRSAENSSDAKGRNRDENVDSVEGNGSRDESEDESEDEKGLLGELGLDQDSDEENPRLGNREETRDLTTEDKKLDKSKAESSRVKDSDAAAKDSAERKDHAVADRNSSGRDQARSQNSGDVRKAPNRDRIDRDRSRERERREERDTTRRAGPRSDRRDLASTDRVAIDDPNRRDKKDEVGHRNVENRRRENENRRDTESRGSSSSFEAHGPPRPGQGRRSPPRPTPDRQDHWHNPNGRDRFRDPHARNESSEHHHQFRDNHAARSGSHGRAPDDKDPLLNGRQVPDRSEDPNRSVHPREHGNRDFVNNEPTIRGESPRRPASARERDGIRKDSREPIVARERSAGRDMRDRNRDEKLGDGRRDSDFERDRLNRPKPMDRDREPLVDRERDRIRPIDRDREPPVDRERDRIRPMDRDREPPVDRERDRIRPMDRDREPPVDRERDRIRPIDRDRELPVDRERDRIRPMDRDRELPVDRERDRIRPMDRDREPPADRERDRIRPMDRDREPPVDRERDRIRPMDRDREPPVDRERDRIRALEMERSREVGRERNWNREQERNMPPQRPSRERPVGDTGPRNERDMSQREPRVDFPRDDRPVRDSGRRMSDDLRGPPRKDMEGQRGDNSRRNNRSPRRQPPPMNQRRDSHPGQREGNRAERDTGVRPPQKRKRGSEAEPQERPSGATEQGERQDIGDPVGMGVELPRPSQEGPVASEPGAPSDRGDAPHIIDEGPTSKRRAREGERGEDKTSRGGDVDETQQAEMQANAL